MILAASGTACDLKQQMRIVRSQLSSTKRVDTPHKPSVATYAHADGLMTPPSDLVLLKWGNKKVAQPI